MPRNSAGVYTLPPTNPVVPFTTIATSWANPTMSDIATALTDSLDRNGRGGMLAPFKIFDGTLSSPGLGFLNEPSLGIYRSAAGVMNLVAGGASQIEITTGGTMFPTEVAHYGDSQYRKAGYKWWQINNWGGALMITPSATADAEDWDTAKSVVFNPDGTVDFPTGALDYLPLTGGTITGNLGVTGTFTVDSSTIMHGALTLSAAGGPSFVTARTDTPTDGQGMGGWLSYAASVGGGSLYWAATENWVPGSAQGSKLILNACPVGSATPVDVFSFSPGWSFINSQLMVTQAGGGLPTTGKIVFGNALAGTLYFDGANFTFSQGAGTWTTFESNVTVNNALLYKMAEPIPVVVSIGGITTVNFNNGLCQILTMTVPGTVNFTGIPNGAILRCTFINTNLGLTITGVSWPNGVDPNFATGPLKKALVVIQNDGGNYLGTYSVF